MDDRDPRRPRPGTEPAGLSPVRAFILLGTLLTAIAAGFFATRDPAPSAPPASPPRSPDYALTDAEAIAEFERLNAQLMQAYEDRNIALAEAVFTSDSPMLPRVRKEIRTLLGSSVVSMTRFEELSTDVTLSRSDLITIERLEILHPRFETEAGESASRSTRPERTLVRWDLRVEDGKWLLHDAVVLKRQILKRDGR